MDNTPVITVHGLSRSYGRVKAVRDLDLEVLGGTVHGFLGPNGAGKTTVIKMLLGLIMPDKGEISVFGRNLLRRRDDIMREVGAVVEAPVFFEYLSAYENLFYLCRMSGFCDKALILDTLKRVGLEDVAQRKVSTFSYGMKQRLGIAQALLPRSRLILLDEPTNGLDPHGIVGVRELVKRLCGELGVTVFISSHLLSEIEQTCDYVTIIDKGVKICESKVSSLVSMHNRIEFKTPDHAAFKEFAAGRGIKLLREETDEGCGIFVFEGVETDIPRLISDLSASGIRTYGIGRYVQTLEEIFIEITGKDKRDFVSDRF